MNWYSESQLGIDSFWNSDEAKMGYKECVNTVEKGWENAANESQSQYCLWSSLVTFSQPFRSDITHSR